MSVSTALISVDVAAFRIHEGKLQVLTRLPDAQATTVKPALPAGRIKPELDNELDDAARRQVRTLIDAEPGYLEQVASIGNHYRDSRGWSLTVVYCALLGADLAISDSPLACWCDIQDGSPVCALSYDHTALVEEAIRRLQSKIQYTTIPLYLLPELFTLADIRDAFRIILGKAPPMRSIRNRFLAGNLLEDSGQKRRGSNRPASLYRLADRNCTRLFNRLYHTTQSE
ncbi:NUDIX domain-containing protein [Kistimonas scapharcae]|uniref:NUDIX domain-containing protein n=1 Tax=Kistimonas scapharcae TaxID=1036133 RepID=A0ABP8V1C3_9GAMM